MPESLSHLKEIMDERDRRYEDRFKAMDEKTSLALNASEKAVSKAETATEKRFDSVNEFRGQLKDQANSLMPREEASARFNAVEEKIEDLKKSQVQKSQFDLRTVLTIISMLVAFGTMFIKTK
jgi:Ni,Fe-hydrogenase I large subunit